MKGKKAVKWIWHQPDESILELIIRALWGIFAINLFFFAGYTTFRDNLGFISIYNDQIASIELLIIGFILFFEVALPVATSFLEKKYIGLIISVVSFAATAFFGVRRFILYFLDNEDELVDGYIELGNAFYDIYMATTIPAAKKVISQVSLTSDSRSAVSFSLLALVFVLLMISYFIRRKHAFLLIPLASFITMMVLGLKIEGNGPIIVFIGILALSCSNKRPKKVGTLVNKRNIPIKEGRGRVLLQRILAVFLVFILYTIFTAPLNNLTVTLAQSGKHFKQVHGNLFGIINASNDDSDRLELTSKVSNKRPNYTGEVVMRFSSPHAVYSNLYFKGHSANKYKNHEWTMDSKGFSSFLGENYGIEDMFYPLFTVPAERYFALGYNRIESDYYEPGDLMNITYVADFGEALYLPYFVDLSSVSDMVYNDDLKLLWEGSNSIVFPYVAGNIVLNPGDFRYGPGYEPGPLADYEAFVAKNYTDTKGNVPAASDIAERIALDNSIAKYPAAITDYSSEENARRIMAAEAVKKYLVDNYSYNLDLDQNISEDPVEYFLSESYEGYCTHFASAGTMILRELNVPARFVTGYILKANSLATNGFRYEADIKDYNAHNWVEVYFDGIGWVPYEMTPGYFDYSEYLPTADNSATSTPTSAATNTPTPTKEPDDITNTPTPEITKPDGATNTPTITKAITATNTPADTKGASSDGSGDGSASPKKGSAVKVIVIIIVILGAGFVGYKQVMFLREKKAADLRIISKLFRIKDYRRYVKKLNRRLYKRCRREANKRNVDRELRRNVLGDKDYLKLLMATYPEVGENEWNKYIVVAVKAAFSEEIITEREAELCKKIYDKLLLIK